MTKDSNIKFSCAVLQTIPELNLGGSETVALDIAQAITDRGGTSLLACKDGDLIKHLQANGSKWIKLNCKSKNPVTIVLNAFRLVTIIRKYDINIVHAHSRVPAWSSLLACRLCRIPFVTSYHGVYSQTNALKKLYNSVMAMGDIIIANSQYTKSIIKHRHRNIASKIRTIYPGVAITDNVSASQVAEQRAKWRVKQTDMVLLVLARLSPVKGQHIAIEAMAEIAAKNNGASHNNVKLILAGDTDRNSNYYKILRTLISNHKLAEFVRFSKKIPPAAVPIALKACDIVVVPSTKPETFGLAAVEAASMSRPVIVSDNGAAMETVKTGNEDKATGQTGWRFKSQDISALATSINEALNLNQHQLAEIGNNGRKYVEASFSRQKMANDIIKTYKQLIRKK